MNVNFGVDPMIHNGTCAGQSMTPGASPIGTSAAFTYFFVVACSIGSMAWAAWHAYAVLSIPIDRYSDINDGDEDSSGGGASANKKVLEISTAIQRGAKAFLFAEYRFLAIFLVVFGALMALAVGFTSTVTLGIYSAIAFMVGGLTSIASGYIGMMIAVKANSRTALAAQRGYAPAFKIAFRAGAVLGFALCGLALIMIFVLINIISISYSFPSYNADGTVSFQPNDTQETLMERVRNLFEALAAYGLGGSAVALFGRVGGGIYTKAADVGADLVGKVEQGIPEDDPRNPAVIADNVGDNVGDIAGMGADLFGSFAESSCAALVIASDSSSQLLVLNPNAMLMPLVLAASGIIACMLTSLVSSHLRSVNNKQEIEPSLKRQLLISTVIESPLIFLVCMVWLPSEFCIADKLVRSWAAAVCAVSGLWAGLLIGYITEYFTSHSYRPVREVANACTTGAATNIIYGLALGYLSVIIPVLALAASIFISFQLASLYGVALAALGILSTLAIGLTIDAYGPISDNAGGIAEMAGLGESVRERTDALDAAGNTTAAIGKGFAIGSAAFVSLALFGAFVTRVRTVHPMFSVDILEPFQFAGLLIGSMLPYAFSALTMKSVGKAALAMVAEVRRQFREIPGIMEGTGQPDYERCVSISTVSSLREMILPGLLVMGSPLVIGFIMGTGALAGMLAGALVSGVQMAISSSNTGGAWDNAKKYIEAGSHGGKGSDAHKAAVIGDTVGDPLKDTSGPALNILMKLMAVESLVFAPFFIHANLCELSGAEWCKSGLGY